MSRRVNVVWGIADMMDAEHNGQRGVREQNAGAELTEGSCHSSGESCDRFEYAKSIGYTRGEMQSVPEGAAVTHGCGNPTALAELREGEVVLDLGCGGGLDVFLAAQRVGPRGKVIGVDMTPEMVARANSNAKQGNYENVDFRLGEIEQLPLADDSVDVAISNCVINHSRDKTVVFREIHRVLKPGGRMFVSDLVIVGKLPDDTLEKVDPIWVDWLRVASGKNEYLSAMLEVGFREVEVVAEGTFPMSEADDALKGRILSVGLRGVKPA